MILWLFDILLAGMLLSVAWWALATPNLFKGTVLFIAFGLLMAVIWARLGAPDLALAEAAIGAGLAGALLLSAYKRMESVAAAEEGVPGPPDPDTPEAGVAGGHPGRAYRSVLLVVLLALVGVLGFAVHGLEPGTGELRDRVLANMPQSGVTHPVTGVLLNFRAYDTLLEVAVLLLAVTGVWAMAPAPRRATRLVRGEVMLALVRLFVPLLIVLATYLLWRGAHAPGGAFQAGALLGAAGVLVLLVRSTLPRWLGRFRGRLSLVAGLAVFIGVGLLALPLGSHFLAYPPGFAGGLILLIEMVAMVSIGVTLAVLFASGRPPQGESAAGADDGKGGGAGP